MNEPAAETKAAAKASPPETEYIVLERLPANQGENGVKHMNGDDIDGDAVWLAIGSATVSGHKDRAVDEVTKGRDGTFKAVSARAWRGGKTNTTETVTKSTPFED